MPEPTLRTVSVDGLSITTTDQGAQVIEKLQRQLADSQKALTDTQAAHQVVIAAKDTELGKKDVEIKDLKDKQLDPAKLDQMAAERADVIGKVKAVFPTLNCDGKSLPDIRRLVAAQQFGDANVKDKSDDYVRALFDGITADTKPVDHSTDSFRAGFTGGGGTRTGANDGKTAYGDMVKNLTTRWQTPNGSDKSAGR